LLTHGFVKEKKWGAQHQGRGKTVFVILSKGKKEEKKKNPKQKIKDKKAWN